MDNENELILETVRELLPEIESSMREAINTQLQQEYAEKFQKEINLLADVDEQRLRQELEAKLREDYEIQKKQLEERIIQEFDEQCANGQLEQQLRSKILAEYDHQVQEELIKRNKQIKLQFKKRLEQERQNLLKAFDLEWKQKVEAEKKVLEREKGELARLRSLKYVKLKKIQEEKKRLASVQKELEVRHNERVQQLQKQIQATTQEIEKMVTEQIQRDQKLNKPHVSAHSEGVSYQKLDKSELPLQVPIYEHRIMTEIDQSELINNTFESKHTQNVTLKQPSAVNGQGKAKQAQPGQQQTKYQQQLAQSQTMKALKSGEQAQKAQPNKENQSKKSNRVEQIIKNEVRPHTPYDSEMISEFYEQQFQENDLDNTKNKQLKQARVQLRQNQLNDQKLQTKFIGLQINIMNEFIEQYIECPDYEELKYLIQQLIEHVSKWKISYGTRMEMFKEIKQLISRDIKEVIPVIQRQIHGFNLAEQQLRVLQRYWELRNEIQQKFQSFSQSKGLFEQLAEVSQHLKSLNFSIQGNPFQDSLKLALWEKDYLEREELKNQLLSKIQSKIL